MSFAEMACDSTRLLTRAGLNETVRSRSKAALLFCRSRLAGEKREAAAFIQDANVIVNVLREQARSHIFDRAPLKAAGRPLCS
ncbi:hypothetical protein A462_13944 [Pseudomonas sp. Ag1]|jgi:hypothetical protein|nr:hypothetical protein A462_13944 [Pseudomonas sp. Ag1]